MILPDVNVLVAAARQDAARHEECLDWLNGALDSDEPIGLAGAVLSGVVRICTHPRVFSSPSSLDEVFGFCDDLLVQPVTITVHPGRRHWSIFLDLCRQADARGNLVTDAYLAALAIETGGEWITLDRDFSRFPGLRLRYL